MQGVVYSTGVPRSLAAFLGPRGIEIREPPPSARAAISEASIVLHHGDLGTVQAALVAGRPQIILPRSMEQEFNATVVENRSLGLRLGDEHPADQAGEALRQWIDEPRVSDLAMAWARTIHADGPSRAREAVVSHCLDILP